MDDTHDAAPIAHPQDFALAATGNLIVFVQLAAFFTGIPDDLTGGDIIHQIQLLTSLKFTFIVSFRTTKVLLGDKQGRVLNEYSV